VLKEEAIVEGVANVGLKLEQAHKPVLGRQKDTSTTHFMKEIT
jgi:hypothetical protein